MGCLSNKIAGRNFYITDGGKLDPKGFIVRITPVMKEIDKTCGLLRKQMAERLIWIV